MTDHTMTQEEQALDALVVALCPVKPLLHMNVIFAEQIKQVLRAAQARNTPDDRRFIFELFCRLAAVSPMDTEFFFHLTNQTTAGA